LRQHRRNSREHLTVLREHDGHDPDVVGTQIANNHEDGGTLGGSVYPRLTCANEDFDPCPMASPPREDLPPQRRRRDDRGIDRNGDG
jgi:hypothetical protein